MTQRLLANDCRRTITPSSSIAPSMSRTVIVSDFLPPKTKSELKEMRNDPLFFRATVSYHPRNWCPPWHWHIDHPRHFWLWIWFWLICLSRSNLTLPITFSPARATSCSGSRIVLRFGPWCLRHGHRCGVDSLLQITRNIIYPDFISMC